MMLKPQIVLLLMVGLMAGCGEVIVFGHTIRGGHAVSDVTPDATSRPEAAGRPRIQVVKAVTLVLTPQVRANSVKDPRIDESALLDAITGELRSRKLLNDADVRASRTADISIDNIEVHPTTNVILFGQIMSTGKISGGIRVRDSNGQELQNFRIEADARLSIAASGEDPNPFGPLYRRFAALAADSLAGTPGKSSAASDQ
jgi:hypothetical protein